MEVSKMETIQIELSNEVSLDAAQEEARNAVAEPNDDLRLIAWYDQRHSTGGPSAACSDEGPECVRDYASSHGGEKRVWVNDGALEFFFSPTGTDVSELDREWALKVHEGAGNSQFDNVQGG